MPELKSFDRVAHVYDETRGLPLEIERQIGDGIARTVREVAPEPRLLEVGIGTGRIAVPVAANGVRVTGVDISAAMLALLREKRRDIDVMFAEASLLPLRSASFDASLFVHILHLVPDAEATIRSTLAVVRPGGVMLLAGDDRINTLRDEADAIIARETAALGGAIPHRDDPHDAAWTMFRAVMAEAGATFEDVTLAHWTSVTQARRMLERLARRDYSSSWSITDEILPKLLERVTPQIETLYGGLDRDVSFERSFSVLVARLP